MQLARRIMIAGGAAAFALIVVMLQTSLAMLGVARSFVAVGFDIPNTVFFVTYLLCAFAFIWGVVGPLPKPSYMLARR
jgi:hypothetical protein